MAADNVSERLNRSFGGLADAMASAGVNLPAPAAAPLHAVAVKLPPFWEPNPRVWFVQCEAAFRHANVTREVTKFDHILTALPTSIVNSIIDLVDEVDEHAEDCYTLLKERLMGKFSLSKWSRCAAIVDHDLLGDRRPSALMDDMLAAHPEGEKPNSLFLYIFLRKLPAEMMDQLGVKDYDKPRELALAADKLWDSRRSRGRPLCAAVESTPLAAISSSSRSPSPSSARRPAQRRATGGDGGRRQRPSTPGPSGYCRLHAKWGEDACQCYPPCSWSKNGQRAGRKN